MAASWSAKTNIETETRDREGRRTEIESEQRAGTCTVRVCTLLSRAVLLVLSGSAVCFSGEQLLS